MYLMVPQLFSKVCDDSELSDTEIAERANVSPGTVRRAKRFERISPDTAYALCAVLRVKLAEVILNVGVNTKHTGKTGTNKRVRPIPERDCNAHGRYPEHLGECPLC